MTTAIDDRLLYETRWRPKIAIVSAIAGILLVVASVLELIGPHASVNELTLGLINEHRRYQLDIISNIVGSIGWAGVAVTLNFLFGAARARNEQINPFFGWMAVIGAGAIAISGIALAIASSIWANDFVTTGSQTYDQAKSLTSGALLPVLSYAGLLGLLLTAVSYVLVSLNAMRVGLLTRFMGYLGIFAGVLTIAAITPVPVVAGYWLVALGVLFLGRWPTGTPPSWRSGKVEPWPSTQQLREEAARQREARGGGGGAGRGGRGGRGGSAPAPAPRGRRGAQPVATETTENNGPSQAAAKRKRKKKRK
jgi:MFS family permease